MGARCEDTSVEVTPPVPAEGEPSRALPSVHLISVCYNAAAYLPGYLAALENLEYPANRLACTIVDNASEDNSRDILHAHRGRVRPVVFASDRNVGFAAGNNIALRSNDAEYILLLNLDTEISPSCLSLLVERMQEDPRAGMCEARQTPYEHPKEYDTETGETPWSSAACLLVRAAALRDTGLFDERFFLYCEDVDLSWRMWATGWKCLYLPEATCKHYSLDLARHKKGSYDEYFFGFRNGLMMRMIYGTPWEWLRYNLSVWRLILCARDHSPAHKRLLLRSLRGQLKHFPHLMIRRRQLRGARKRCRWIRFHGWDYHRSRARGTNQHVPTAS